MKIKTAIFSISLLFIILCRMYCSAQDAIFSQFFSTPLYLNPAFAGTDDGFRFVTNYRNHPLSDVNKFSTVNASVDGYVENLSGGVGLIVTSDHQGGLVMKNRIDGIYAYHLQVSDGLFLNLGAQAGYYRKDISWSKLVFSDPNQPPPYQEYRHSANFATGVLFYNNWMFGGIAAHHITQPIESLITEDKLPIKYTAHFGINIDSPGKGRANTFMLNYFISPNIIYQHQGGYNRINYGLYGGIQSVMAGVWYRQDLSNPSAVIFLVGLKKDNYRIGYSYDYSMSGYSDAFHGAHEVSLSLLLGKKISRNKVISCPQF